MRLLNHLKNIVSPQLKPSASEINPNWAYDLLANERRQHIIAYLAEFDINQEVTVSDIADHLSMQHGDDRTAAYISLLQSHLDKFDPNDTSKTSVIDYDDRAKVVYIKPELHRLYDAHQVFTDELNSHQPDT